jgi:aminocarboxymuconate-semialdehyde decarboxylase
MAPLIDVHCHLSPFSFPPSPNEAVRGRWPCMQCASASQGVLMVGDHPFRKLDHRSWDVDRRVEDMDRDGVTIQVLSPMPELLSYWLPTDDAVVICDHVNAQIAEMMSARPKRFRGLGSVTLQDPHRAARDLSRLKKDFGLSGVEIGSNINGIMLGDPSLDPFWAEAEAQGMVIFVHALHPVAVKSIPASPVFTAFAGFPIDVAMAAASMMMAGTFQKYPSLRIAFSHGGGALGSILGRLDKGWEKTAAFGHEGLARPSEQAKALFYDSNVYEPAYLAELATRIAPGRVFAGTDYPYDIMQDDPAAFLATAGLSADQLASLRSGAASAFLDEAFG